MLNTDSEKREFVNNRYRASKQAGEPPISVYVRCSVLSMTKVDTISQTFTLDMQLTLSWYDSEFVDFMETDEWKKRAGMRRTGRR